jgi:predicted RecB family endonuclease
MAFLALGINHKTASVDVRERVAFTPEQLVEALQQLCRLTDSREAAILSTCNRSELYIEQDHLSADVVLRWLADYHHLSLDELRASAYVHEDDAAVRHMMRVASGLDSLVLGEPQILGQMKSAYAVAREAGTIGPLLGRLFQATFNAAKQVRTDTAIGENPVSVAFAAVSLAKQIFSDLQRSQALLIGAGETITLVARHLHDLGVKRIVVANRTLERASLLAEQFGAHAVLLSDIRPNWCAAISSSVPPPASCRSSARARGKRAEAAQAQADLHGRHRRSPGYRAGSRRVGRRLPVQRRRSARSGRRKPQEPPGRCPGGRRDGRSAPTISWCACANWRRSMCSRPIVNRANACATKSCKRPSVCWPTAATPKTC